MSNYLHTIAEQLNAAADELERVAGACNCPSGSYCRGDVHALGCPARNPTIERHWAKHFREDAKSMRLLAEVYVVELVSTSFPNDWRPGI